MRSCSDYDWRRVEDGCMFLGFCMVKAQGGCMNVCFSIKGLRHCCRVNSRSRAERPLFGQFEFREELPVH